MVYAVSTSDNLETIDMKFLESGHSMMEVDSMHAAIETKRKHQKVYNTHEWGMICTATRERNPYTVTELEFTDFMDFHKLVEETVVNHNKSISGQNVNWLKLKWLRFIKAKPNSILVKERLTDDEFQEIIVNQSVGRRVHKNSPEHQWMSTRGSCTGTSLQYTQMLHISVAKKQDLVNLVRVVQSLQNTSTTKEAYQAVAMSGMP